MPTTPPNRNGSNLMSTVTTTASLLRPSSRRPRPFLTQPVPYLRQPICQRQESSDDDEEEQEENEQVEFETVPTVYSSASTHHPETTFSMAGALPDGQVSSAPLGGLPTGTGRETEEDSTHHDSTEESESDDASADSDSTGDCPSGEDGSSNSNSNSTPDNAREDSESRIQEQTQPRARKVAGFLREAWEDPNQEHTIVYRYRDFGGVTEDSDVFEKPQKPADSYMSKRFDWSAGQSASPNAPLDVPPKIVTADFPLLSQRFPVKLYIILARKEFEHIISWLPHGRSWRIREPALFEHAVMPIFFECSNYNSFNRLINAWSFRRMCNGTDRGSYYHELFLRGRPHLQKYMRRLPKSHKKLPMRRNDEPDFYELSKVSPLPEVSPIPMPAEILRRPLSGLAVQDVLPPDSVPAKHATAQQNQATVSGPPANIGRPVQQHPAAHIQPKRQQLPPPVPLQPGVPTAALPGQQRGLLSGVGPSTGSTVLKQNFAVTSPHLEHGAALPEPSVYPVPAGYPHYMAYPYFPVPVPYPVYHPEMYQYPHHPGGAVASTACIDPRMPIPAETYPVHLPPGHHSGYFPPHFYLPLTHPLHPAPLSQTPAPRAIAEPEPNAGSTIAPPGAALEAAWPPTMKTVPAEQITAAAQQPGVLAYRHPADSSPRNHPAANPAL